MLIDTHGHLNFNAYKDDSEEVFKKALDADMGIVMPGSQYSTSRRAVQLAEKWDNPRVWAAIGLHPIHLEDRKVDKHETGSHIEYETRREEFDRAAYEELARSEKTIAIGEVGLDYWHRPKEKEERHAYEQTQAEAFKAQLDLAVDVDLPVILHCRIAHKDMIKILEEHPITEKREIPGIVHSYTGSVKQLKKYLDMGYYIGVNGLIFKLGLMEEAVEAAPLDRIVLETDAPYLTPPQVGEDERNEPYNLKYVAERIAEIKDLFYDEVEEQTAENAKRVFGKSFAE